LDLARTFFTSDGATLAYRLWRPSRPRRLIVLVHGLASNHTRWAEFVATTRLRESWDLLRLDLRGFAGSLYRGRVGLNEWSRDVAAILAAEGAPRAVLVGHCLGANVALHVAAHYPSAAHGLVLVEPMLRPALRGAPRLAARLRPLAVSLVPLIRGLNALGVYRRHLEKLDLEQLDGEARAAMAVQGPAAFPEDRYGSVREDLKSSPTGVYLAGLLAVTAPLPNLHAIQVPTLALLSSGGRFGDPVVTARLLAELPQCDARMLDARHWIPTECPTQMRQAIERWCDGLPA
jgi:pimeloyl-ACP methyl ester carboxylesterase